MPKIRIREFVVNGERQSAIRNVSLGSRMLREPQVIKGRDSSGKEIEQYMPGTSVCMWLVPRGQGNEARHRYEVYDVTDEEARILVDDRGWCERMPGRPKKSDTPAETAEQTSSSD